MLATNQSDLPRAPKRQRISLVEGLSEDRKVPSAVSDMNGAQAALAPEPAGPEPAEQQQQQRLGRQGLIDRGEYLRLIQQSLTSLGFAEVASSLEVQSGVPCHSPAAAALQRSVLAGDWDAADLCLSRLAVGCLDTAARARFLLLEHKFLEELHQGDVPAALHCLRRDLGPLAPATAGAPRLRQLASCLLCPTPRDLERHSVWRGAESAGSSSNAELGPKPSRSEGAAVPEDGSLEELPSSSSEGSGMCCGSSEGLAGCCGRGSGDRALAALRRGALAQLRRVLPPALLLPSGRLEALVEQALQAQLARCPLHNSPGAVPSLLVDHACGLEQLPTVAVQVLTPHRDEVWHCAFSPNGAMLASASKDGTAVVYDVRGRGAVAVRHVLRGHAGAVAFLAWSPDSRQLATCGQDGSVRVWDVREGRCAAWLKHHQDAVTSAAWMPDSQSLITGSHDKSMCWVDLHGQVLRRWVSARVQDLLVAKEGRYVLATTSERRVRVYDLRADPDEDGDREAGWVAERNTIISMALSADSRCLLVSLATQELHLWDLGPGPELCLPLLPCAAYLPRCTEPGRHSRYVVRACLGGLDQRFVLTGSEECKVYMYQRQSGELLAELDGHTGTVNAVSWNPTDPHMFASVSDDRTVRIWGLEAAVAARL